MADEATPIEPGLWAYTANTFVIGVKSGRQCVKREQVEEFLTGPRNRHYRCTYPDRSIGGGRISFSGDCLDKGDRHRYHLVVRGNYRPESFDLEGSVAGPILGLSLTLPLSIHAHRIAATCTE